jgi:hypothetical protein
VAVGASVRLVAFLPPISARFRAQNFCRLAVSRWSCGSVGLQDFPSPNFVSPACACDFAPEDFPCSVLF